MAERGTLKVGGDWQNTHELAWRIRRHVIEMTHRGNSSHIGSMLSIADILAVLYGAVLNVDPANPKSPDRDRFILSKGHAGACVYATLAECGFLPVEKLKTHYQNGSDLSGHVSHKGIPGVELSTGSLGHGLSVGCGMAFKLKQNQEKNLVVVVMSDGECDEGSNWEAILFASHHKLDNLTSIVDYNKLQSILSTQETLALEPFADKWQAFGWHVIECDGHDVAAILEAYQKVEDVRGVPKAIIAHTVKGKGVSFMEYNPYWHSAGIPPDLTRKALDELRPKVPEEYPVCEFLSQEEHNKIRGL